MKTYDKYKPSGIEWIGEIPENWEVSRFKFWANYQKGKMPSLIDFESKNDSPIYLSMDFLRGSNSQVQYAINYEGCTIIEKNDTLLLWDGANAGEFMKGKNGVLSSTMVKIIPSQNLNKNYCWFELQTFEIELRKATYGMGIPHVNTEFLKNSFHVLPPFSEQTSIANYLDEKTVEIDQTIADKEELIKLYEEEKKALINEAVTKGLNPNVKLKPSGIDWLGDIPEHWEVKKLFYLFNKISSGTTPKSDDESYYVNGTINWLNTGDLNNTYITETSKKITQKAFDEHSALKVYPKGSIVIAMYGATIGKLGILEIETTTNQACCVLSDIKNVSTLFVFYCLISGQDAILNLSYGGGQPNISQDTLRSFKIPFPPINEQTQIVKFIEWESNLINEKINTTQQEIALLIEYRQALIFEAVTGKICVL